MSELWRQYRGDFNSMTDDEIEWEVRVSEDLVNEHESWLEAVASWKDAGKPRSDDT